MCRYAGKDYKIHFPCFSCRKMFRQPSMADWLRVRGMGFALRKLWACRSEQLRERERELGLSLADLEAQYRAATFRCPECGEPMADLGRDFKPPRKSNIRAWKAVAKVYQLGHVFQTCGCDGSGFIPANQTEYRRYLEQRRQEYQRELDRCSTIRGSGDEQQYQRTIYWRERLATIDAAIASG